nr:hypothetical protein B0A51_05796 [Rachicladosporium sp. CCFEE 5018]
MSGAEIALGGISAAAGTLSAANAAKQLFKPQSNRMPSVVKSTDTVYMHVSGEAWAYVGANGEIRSKSQGQGKAVVRTQNVSRKK